MRDGDASLADTWLLKCAAQKNNSYFVSPNVIKNYINTFPPDIKPCLTIEGSGIILCQITELITAKVGGDNQTGSFLSTLITVGTTVAAAYIPGAGTGASAAAKALVAGQKASIVGLGKITGATINKLQQSVYYFETKEQVSIHEFKHKYLFSKTRPLSLRLEWNQESFNQYRNKKELLGINRADFFNVESMGELLNNEGFLQATIISWSDIPHA